MLDKLDAIRYLVRNGPVGSDEAKASLFDAIELVLEKDDSDLTLDFLDSLIDFAEHV
jgi:hypothetical protein